MNPSNGTTPMTTPKPAPPNQDDDAAEVRKRDMPGNPTGPDHPDEPVPDPDKSA